MPTLEQTVYDIAVRALNQQEQTLNELRSRTATLLTASSLIASFLGAQAVARGGFSVWIVLALTAFAFSVGLSIYALLQTFRQGNHATVQRVTWVFEVSAFALLAEIGFLALALLVS